jgi:dipeptidyl aminopeptidase/acylaminoacyl peptidase
MINKTVNTSATQESTLIPRQTLFGNPERTSPKLSPDGKYIAYMAPDDNNVLQIWLREIGQEESRQLTNQKKCYIWTFFWTDHPEQLIYLQDFDGDENFHLYSVNIQSNIVKDLTPFQGVQAEVIALEPELPDEILVGLNLKDPQTFDVYRINLNNGAVEFDTENLGNIVTWKANAKLQILAAIAATSDGGYDLLYREEVNKPWQKLLNWNADDDGEMHGFSKNDQTLYITAFGDANTRRLLAIDLKTKQETVIAEDEQYDVYGAISHPTKRHIQAVTFYKDKLRWQVLDETITADFKAISSVRPGEINLVSRDLEDQKWLIAYQSDNTPTYYYIYERKSKSSTLLFSDRPKLEQLPLVSVQPIAYQTRDDLTIHGYLTLPQGLTSPYASVLLVHGGPWMRDTWWFDPRVQWLANRGYAVLQPNFRGSAGYGKAFLNAGNRQWGAAMHNDLIDGINWLVDEGIADKSKIAIMGISYGGYATLVGLTFTPDVFACGVDLVGPSNLITFIKNIPSYWVPHMAMLKHRVGDLETEEEFLKSRSPLFFVNKIQKPLLIGQGAKDPRVKEADSEQIVEAMRQAGKSVQYVLYTDEGHGFARPENRLHFYAIAEEFLAEHLGGRFEPVGTIEGHSGVIKE